MIQIILNTSCSLSNFHAYLKFEFCGTSITGFILTTQFTELLHVKLLQLELKYAAQTDSLEPPHRYVPWVVVDGQPLYEVCCVMI